jgi:nicotinamidase/pyrazinamidase
MKKILLRILLAIAAFILIVILNLVVFNMTAKKITEGVPIPDSGRNQTALLIIDIQEGTTGTISATQSYKNQADELISNVNHFAEEALEKGWTVIYIHSEVVNPLINLINNTLARGSEGANLDHRLMLASDHIVTKRKNDSFNGTDLDQLLIENNVGTIVVTGLDAAHCVHSAILAALNRNYQVAIFPEAIIAAEEADMERMMTEFSELGVEVID